ncbi:hypothetical protein F4802DRAFT_21728 [Xylaria palmicola]|nr:hypothetical protein F4802DRAFT_21728 [Xylaria palmicola]
MDAPSSQPGPQSQTFTTANDEIASLRQTVAHLTQVQALNTTIADLTARVASLETQLASLRDYVDDIDFNSKARALNSSAVGGEARLHPLRNTTTHQVPERLPSELSDFESPDVITDAIQALGLKPRYPKGDVYVLKEFMGIRP